MNYTTLGKTGLKVSRLSFGASALGGVYGEVDELHALQAVHAALDCGINYFDVAPAYGGTLAETVLGKALKGITRSRYFLSTKVGKNTCFGSYGNDTLTTLGSGFARRWKRAHPAWERITLTPGLCMGTRLGAPVW